MPTADSFDLLRSLSEIGGFETSLPTLNEQAVIRRKLARQLLDEAQALEKIISGVNLLKGTPNLGEPGALDRIEAEVHAAIDTSKPAEPADVPRGVEAVRAVMLDGGVWTVDQVYKTIMRRDWIDESVMHPRKAVETAVNRLYSKYGEVERVGRGRYRYKTAPTDPTLLNGSGSAEP